MNTSPYNSTARRAFTIMELLVVITILGLIMVAMSVIWSAQRSVVQASAAQTEVAPYARALESNLRRDLNGLARDGFMVIRTASIPNYVVNGDPAHTYHYDQLMFFANGLKNSVEDPTVSSMISRVWYGHLVTTDWGNLSDTDKPGNPNNVSAWKFSLGRQDLLLAPGATGAPTTPFPYNSGNPSSILKGQCDYAATDLTTIKANAFVNNSIPTAIPLLVQDCFRIQGSRYIDPNYFNSNGVMPIHALMAPYCSSFHIQFAGRYNTSTPTGQVDVYPAGHTNSQGQSDANQIIWYGTDETGTFNPPPNTTNSGPFAVVSHNPTIATCLDSELVDTLPHYILFSPDQPDLWPSLIQVTVDLHDSNGRFHQRFKDNKLNQATANDGYQYRFIIKL